MSNLTETTPPRLLFSNKTYDVLKFISLILLPALAALYFSLAELWDLPKAKEVVGTITIIDTFLGLILKMSTIRYDKSDMKYDGVMKVSRPIGENKVFSLQLHSDPEVLEEKHLVTLKVEKI